MKIVIIDNYDSFTYNLAHLIKELGAEVSVYRNDQPEVQALIDNADNIEFDKIVLSPGPGIPSEAGLLLDVIRTFAGKKPMLGVCLGHQAIGEVFGGQLTNLSDVFHGVATEGSQFGNDPIFAGLPERITMGRYHSWVVSKDGFPECLEITAESDEGQVMALRHKEYDIHGIQFHPESVLTTEGKTMIGNWLQL
ncbi:MAG: aminodeoxychorismate/anthranilate synthase component II [Prevotellaceae bacterium]|nr:aminodeoxychorismate/anthranilate synthase component II [Prevotellaceae bacterium]